VVRYHPQFLTKTHQMIVTIKDIEIDVRSEDCLYVTIGDWVVYIDNSTGEKIIDSFKKSDHE